MPSNERDLFSILDRNHRCPQCIDERAGILTRRWLSEDFRVIAEDDSFLLLVVCFVSTHL